MPPHGRKSSANPKGFKAWKPGFGGLMNDVLLNNQLALGRQLSELATTVSKLAEEVGEQARTQAKMHKAMTRIQGMLESSPVVMKGRNFGTDARPEKTSENRQSHVMNANAGQRATKDKVLPLKLAMKGNKIISSETQNQEDDEASCQSEKTLSKRKSSILDANAENPPGPASKKIRTTAMAKQQSKEGTTLVPMTATKKRPKYDEIVTIHLDETDDEDEPIAGRADDGDGVSRQCETGVNGNDVKMGKRREEYEKNARDDGEEEEDEDEENLYTATPRKSGGSRTTPRRS